MQEWNQIKDGPLTLTEDEITRCKNYFLEANYEELEDHPKILQSELNSKSLSVANLGLLSDVICCPGGDFCALANAKSLPIAESIQRKFSDEKFLRDVGELRVNISGCMNACGHHHVGNIGILGVDKKGEEFYQISLGGSSKNKASIGKIIGPAFSEQEIPEIIDKIINIYRASRNKGETFIETYNRIGLEPFKEYVYAKPD